MPKCCCCQSGMLMAIVTALRGGHHGNEIASKIKNICLCGIYQRVKQAVAGL